MVCMGKSCHDILYVFYSSSKKAAKCLLNHCYFTLNREIVQKEVNFVPTISSFYYHQDKKIKQKEKIHLRKARSFQDF